MKRFFHFENDGEVGSILYSEIAGWQYNENSGFAYLKGGSEISIGALACHELELYFGVFDEAKLAGQLA